jgi:hypothetical protein
MKTTTLQFPSIDALFEFKQLTNTRNCKIEARKLLLTADLNDAQVQVAMQQFNATIIKEKAA